MSILSRKQISMQMAGATTARLMDSFEDVVTAVQEAYPGVRRDGSAGGWSWVQDGIVVAASNPSHKPPYGRHWLALRPK